MIKERYIGIVVSAIKKYDVAFNVLMSEELNMFGLKDYYVTELMGKRFTNPMAFFNGVNWYQLCRKITDKYGVSDEDQLVEIKEQLREYFIENH